MNEKIRELAEQAGFNYMGIWKIIGIEEYHQRFAELIVKECLNICQECIDDGCVEAEEPQWKIEEHFGVESE